MKKRFGAMLLVLCMVLSLVPMTALAAGEGPRLGSTSLESGQYYNADGTVATDDNYAIKYADNTVTLNDVTLTTTLTVPDETTVDLIGTNSGNKISAEGNVTVTSASSGSYSGTEIQAEGKITINGSAVITINKTGNNAISGKTGVDIIDDAQVNSTTTGQGAIRSENGAVTINSTKEVRLSANNSGSPQDAAIYTGTLSSTEKDKTSFVKSKVVVTGGGTAFTSYNGDIVVDGGTLDATNWYKGLMAENSNIKIANNARVTISRAADSTYNSTYALEAGKEITIENSTIDFSGFGWGIGSCTKSTIKDSYGKINATSMAFLSQPIFNFSDNFNHEIMAGNTEALASKIVEAQLPYFNIYNKKFFQIREIQPPKTFKVTFDLAGGTGYPGESYDAVTVVEGNKINMPKEPTKPGYIFDRWRDEENHVEMWGSTPRTTYTYTPKCDLNFKAQWLKTCTITTSVLGEGGTITPTQEISPDTWWSTEISIVANPGYKIKNVTVDGINQGPIGKYIFNPNNEMNSAAYQTDHTVTAEFEELTYTLTIVNGEDTEVSTVHYGERQAPETPKKENYVFTGWKVNNTDVVYYAGQMFNLADNTTLTAQWQKAENYVDTTVESNKLNVTVDVAIAENTSAEVTQDSKDDLLAKVKTSVQDILNGQVPDGMTQDDADTVRTLLNVGAPKTEVTLTVNAALQGDLNDEQAALKEAMASGESAQVWNLSVALSVTNKDSGGTQIGVPANITVNETTSDITFQLTTGENLSGKTVRVLYLHDGKVETADSTVTDAANGVVTVQANKFSPYAILSKTRHSSSSSSGTTTYPVAVADKAPAGGTVRVDRTSAAKGATVTVTATAEKGYAVGSVTVVGKDGQAVAVTAKDGKYTFVMPAQGVTVAAVFKADAAPSGDWDLGYRGCLKDSSCPIAPFADAQATAWYHDGVHFCLENGLMVGTGTGIFQPSASTSRAMLSVMLWRLNGSPVVNYAMPFTDVAENSWYGEAVRWAASEGIVTGYDAQTFGPNNNVTREQMVTILYRYAQTKGYDVSVGENTNLLSYADAASVSAYATPAMQWACGSGLVQGTDNRLDPQGSTTRAQMATMMMRFCAEIVK